MKHIEIEAITPYVRTLLEDSMGEEYADLIVKIEGFMLRIRDNLEASERWKTDETFYLNDVLRAIGIVIYQDLNERSLTI